MSTGWSLWGAHCGALVEVVARIAGQLQRDREAIRCRVIKLGLLRELAPTEAERLRRVVGRS